MADFEELFEKLPDGVTLHDASDGSIVETNKQFCEMLGYTRDELLGLGFEDLHVDEPPYTTERAETLIRKAANEGPQTFEWLDRTKTGDPLPVEVHLSLTTIDGEDRILAVVRDITERKRRQQQLAAERIRANALFEQLGEPSVEVEFDDSIPIVAAVNEAFEETFGVDERQVVGEAFDEIFVPESGRDRARSINRRIEAGEIIQAELERPTADGRGTFLLRTVPYSLDGTPRAYGIYFDVTDRQRREDRFQAFIEQSTDVIAVLDPDGTYQYLSPSAERILGYDVEVLVGEVAFEFVHPEDRERVMATFSEAVSSPEITATAEFRFRHGDGSWIWLESIGNNQLDNPAIEGFIVNSRDITERIERERSLERERDRLDEFAGVVSHDLRNPLDVAQGRLALAQDDCENEHLDAVNRAHDRMEQLMDDLLSLARAGEAIGETEAVELAALAESCWRNVETKTAELVVETEAVVQAHELRLKQLLENVLRNAVDHGGGDVTITVGDVPEGFYIEDDGPGVPETVRSKVLEPGFSTSEEGSGFGLSIVRDIADAHDWTIEVTGSTDGGARFEFTAVDLD